MSLTRFKDARAGEDGPVSGAIVAIPLCFEVHVVGGVEVYTQSIDLPAGMALKMTSINVQANNIAGDPQIKVGSTVAGAERVTEATMAAGDLTILSTFDAVAAGGIVSVTITCDATLDAYDGATVTLYAYVTAPPTSVLVRGDQGHF